jgi:transposase-like protein
MGNKRNTYSKEFKIMVVKSFLSNEYGGLNRTTREFNLPSKGILPAWIKKYKEYGEIAFEENRGKIKRQYKKSLSKASSIEEEMIRLKAENEYLKRVLESRENLLKKKK